MPGGGVSGVENAYLSYTGLKPFGGRMAIEAGIMDVPYTMDEATSSNDIMFMERASPGVIATNIAAGDFRSAAGTRWFNDQLWIGGYVTGPSRSIPPPARRRRARASNMAPRRVLPAAPSAARTIRYISVPMHNG